ncbi:sensor histidine kinase [Maridesulfovibrio sp.]|uniref:sensor histidine kinase n=1 Tax=Maridesulfovibrio sp. TaxID=2795000 RepID=UPI0039EEBDBD
MQVVFFALTACALLIVSYSILVNFYFEKGLLLSVRHRLELEASSYAKAYLNNPNVALPAAANFKTYLNYDHLPKIIRSRVDEQQLPQIGFCLIRSDNIKDMFYFVYAWTRPDGNELYFVYSLGQEDKFELIHTAEHALLYYAIGTGVAAFLIIIIIAIFMIRRITKKVLLLTDWAFSLNKDNIESAPPDCQYKELNDLAILFKKNMSRQLAGIRREQKFLRNASHELRTPVAVLQTNMDWLKRLGASSEKQYDKPLSGMSTAIKNMKELTSTILWSGKRDISSIPKAEIKIREQILRIISDNSYLLKNKDIQIFNHLEDKTMVTSEAIARIIWSNVIRNAFQHTDEGAININLSGHILTVNNDLPPNNDEYANDSFGLGLMLIQDLVERIGWELIIKQEPNIYSVTLHMHSS